MSPVNTTSSKNILKILNEQRTNGNFCDVIIKLSSDHKMYAHFCVIAPQSNFVGSNLFTKSAYKFSIQNPLVIEILNFDCNHCLELMFHYLYQNEIIIEKEHETHFWNLCKILQVDEIVEGFRTTEKSDEAVIHPPPVIENKLIRVPPKKNLKLAYATSSKQSRMHYCYNCNYKCYKPSIMLHHLQCCKPVMSLKCSLCDQTCNDVVEFNEHLQLHNNSKAFFCTKCDQRFVTRTALHLHLPKHSSETPFMCSYCGKGFKWKHGLENHLIVHSNEKKLLCDECGYSTAHLKTLKAHKLTHNGKVWRCTVNGCSHTTTRKESLKMHAATHRKETPFVCEICGHRFSQNKNLKRHFLLHIAKDLYKCAYCSFTSYRSDKLREHQCRQHINKPLIVELG